MLDLRGGGDMNTIRKIIELYFQLHLIISFDL